jgi:hypothetical protein
LSRKVSWSRAACHRPVRGAAIKAFSPAGMAVKGFFGFGAKSFGNPLGATSGNGGTSGEGSNPPTPGPPALVWHTIASPTAGVAIGGLTALAGALYIVDANGLVYKSADGALTWPNVGNSAAPGQGNIVTGAAGRLIAAGTGPNSARSDDGGVTWTPTGLVANTGGAATMGSNGIGGIWCTTNAGVNGNRAYSINNGTAWNLGVDAPLDTQSVQLATSGWDGTDFGAAFTLSGGIIASSPDGHVWTEVGDPGGLSFSIVTFINGLWIACGEPSVLSSTTLAGLNTAQQFPLPLTDGCFAFAGSPTGVYVGADDTPIVCNATNIAGPYTPTTFPGWAAGEAPTMMVYDTVHAKFVVVSDAGNVSWASSP